MTAPPPISKLDRASPLTLARRLRSEFRNWYVIAPLSWLALPSRLPPRRGVPRLGRAHITVRLRDGGRASCRVDEFFSFVEVFVFREYDVPGVDWQSIETIGDVGANVGAATLWFARRAPRARIIAVEPASAAVSLLEANIRENDLGARVRVIRSALGASAGTRYLDAGTSSVFARVVSTPAAGAEKVSVVTMTELLEKAEVERFDLLKLDCEGAEYEIITSARADVLARIRVIVGEYHDFTPEKRARVSDHLTSAGFECRFEGDSLGLFCAIRSGEHGGPRHVAAQ